MRMSLGIRIFVIFLLGAASSNYFLAAESPEKDVDSSYTEIYQALNLIHTGDKLKIDVDGEPDLSGVFLVDSKGRLKYPLLGEIQAAGRSIEALKTFLLESLEREYLVNPEVDIEFAESPSKSVVVLGRVAKPGNYVLSPDLTLSKLIARVGGFTTDAAAVSVKISRLGKGTKRTLIQADADGILKGSAEDVKLFPGDMIFVDMREEKKVESKVEVEERYVTILGQVAKPGNYKIEDKTTLIRLVGELGGFSAVAATSRVRVVRASEGGGRKVFYVDAGKIMAGGAEDVKLESGDLIVVEESFF